MEKDYSQHQSGSGEKQGKSILSYLAQKNGQSMEALMEEIHSLQREIEELKDEIDVLESTSQPEHFMEFALEHSRRTADNLNEMIHLEFAEIDEEEKRISERHKQKIMELDAKMQKGIQYAYKIMNNMIEKPIPEETPVSRPVKEAKVKKEETYQTYQEEQPVYTQKEPAQQADDVKIIEGFWDEPKIEETPKIETPISEKEKEKEREKEKENVTGLKNMYIIGKVAGEDLFDNSGKLIVAKNEVITEEIIDKAEKVGNLIELVLEMKLQEG